MDVLAYSAFNQQVALNQQITQKTSCLSSKCSETAAQQATAAGFDAATVCWVQCREPCLLRVPQSTTNWDYIPSLTGASTGFKVCDANAQFNCGATCTWTVPAGVTRARFQLWGAGGGSGIGCCCGGSSFGATGAYASVIIPVTASSTYNICSGCAYCCFPSVGGVGRLPGCPSYVSGTGLVNFCAAGGPGPMGNWMATYGRRNTFRLARANYDSGGPCFCNAGADYCFSNSCGTCGVIQHVPGAAYFGTTNSASSPSIVYGVRGMWPCITLNTNNYGCETHPPIVGFVASSQCNPTWTSGNCCGYMCRAACNILLVPGAGGFVSHQMGGGTGGCGDMGRMGMVCVTYC